VSAGSYSLIDNIFSNDISLIYKSGIIESDFSDHFSIFTCSKLEKEKRQFTKEEKTCFDYRYLEDLNNFLVENLENFQNETNPEQACSKLIEVYHNGKYKIFKKEKNI
jgi:hypothetical protein